MNKLTILFLLGLAALGAGAPLPCQARPEFPAVSANASDVSERIAAFELALAEWEAKLAATDDRAEKRALKKAHPATAIADEMATFARANDTLAARWCLENIKDLGLKRSQREELRLDVYGVLVVAKDARLRDWTLDELIADSTLSRKIGMDGLEAIVKRFIAAEPIPARQGHARALFAKKLQRSREPKESERGLSMLRALAAGEGELGDEDHTWIETFLFKLDFLSVGKTAPAFEGKSVDGEPIALENFRGKVTVLSFFGFW